MFPENIMSWINRWNLVEVWHWCIWYLSIHITDQLGFSVVELLPAFHSITCCDSVSSYFGIGKENSFETLKANSESLTGIRLFVDSQSLSNADDHVTTCIKFVFSLYDKSHEEYKINYLWNKLFTQKNLIGKKLPQTSDSLLVYLQWKNYRCYTWKSAFIPILEHFPVGWVKNGEILEQ